MFATLKNVCRVGYNEEKAFRYYENNNRRLLDLQNAIWDTPQSCRKT